LSVRRRIIQSITAVLSNQFINLGIQFIGFPLFLTVWGVGLYGEWLILSAFVTGIAMSDFGLTSATSTAMTVTAAKGDFSAAVNHYLSGWQLITFSSLLISFAILSLSWQGPVVSWLNFQYCSPQSILWTISTLVLQTLVSIQTTLLHCKFRACGKMSLTIYLATAVRLAEFLAQICAAAIWKTLESAALAGLVIRVVEYYFTLGFQRNHVAWAIIPWRSSFPRISLELLRPALASVAFPMGQLLGNQAILALIGSQLGAASVTIFTAHRTLANICLQCAQTVGISILPELSMAWGSGEHQLVRKIHRKSCQLTWAIGLISAIGVGLSSQKFLEIWSRGKVEYDFVLMLCLLTATLIRTIWYTSYVVPMSRNLHHRTASLYLAGTVVSLVVAVFVTPVYGLSGAVVSLAVSDVMMSFYVPIVALSMTNDTAIDFLMSFVFPVRKNS